MTEDDQQNQNPRGPLIGLAAVVVIFVLGLLLFIPFPYQIDFAMYGNDVMDLTSAGLRSM
jgi:hypothetical protein